MDSPLPSIIVNTMKAPNFFVIDLFIYPSPF